MLAFVRVALNDDNVKFVDFLNNSLLLINQAAAIDLTGTLFFPEFLLFYISFVANW